MYPSVKFYLSGQGMVILITTNLFQNLEEVHFFFHFFSSGGSASNTFSLKWEVGFQYFFLI